VNKLSNILNKGLKSIQTEVAKSIEKNDRSATGKTIRSLQVDVQEDLNKATGELSGRGNITTLEAGQGPKNVDSNDILEWMRARGIQDKYLYPIVKKLESFGWNTTLPNRTNPKGGTKGIITDPINEGLNDIVKEINDYSETLVINNIDISIEKFK